MGKRQQRTDRLQLIQEACTGGAHLTQACTQIGLSERTAQRWPKPDAQDGDHRVYCWDITYLPTQVLGSYFYLYLFVDPFSRKIVGWQVHDCENAQLASGLLQDICARHGIAPGQLVVRSDNGPPMKGETMLATMQRLGVAPSRSRPSVSNDNPYSESLFRTLKYRPAKQGAA